MSEFDFYNSCVYFIRMYDAEQNPTNIFKIGQTSNISKRIDQLRFGCPYPLQIHHIVFTDDANVLEKEYHQMFQQYRLHHEWFRFPNNIIEQIQDFNV